MTEEAFIEALEASIEGMSGKLGSDVAFRKVDGWDSLANLFLLNTIDEHFGIQMDAVSLSGCVTLGEVYRDACRKSGK